MPWKEQCRVDARTQFVLRALEEGCNRADLCREFGVSRKTGYKWLDRYKALGWQGLEDESRRPDKSPLRISADAVAAIVRTRLAFPRVGPKKLAALLRRELGDQVPSVRTVARVLKRAGMMQPLRRRPRVAMVDPGRPKPVMEKPNDLWTVDFKGNWFCKSGERFEPLTVRDGFSRFVLAASSLEAKGFNQVRATFEELFRTYGLPKAIQSDNGTPFVSANSWHGLSALNVWWTSLGIEHVRSRVGKPADNGAHERMHKDIAEELEAFAALNGIAQQLACDKWRHDFNQHRPHEALKMKTPAEVYRRSEVAYAESATIDYPESFQVRHVSGRGCIKLQAKQAFLSSTLADRDVGLEWKAPNRYVVWYAARQLGVIDLAEDRPTLKRAA